MKPVRIADPDEILTSPDADVGDLHVSHGPEGERVSVWTLTDDEIDDLLAAYDRQPDGPGKLLSTLRNAGVLLTVDGHHPPVSLTAQASTVYEESPELVTVIDHRHLSFRYLTVPTIRDEGHAPLPVGATGLWEIKWDSPRGPFTVLVPNNCDPADLPDLRAVLADRVAEEYDRAVRQGLAP